MSSLPAGSPFPSGSRLGIAFIIGAACLSAISVTSLLLYIGYSTVKLKRGASRKWSTSTHVHYYFLNLLVSDLIQAIGGILNAKWLLDDRVTEGALCTAQGALKQVGDVGVALSSVIIAVHTLSILVFRYEPRPSTAIIVLSAVWITIGLIIGVSFATHKGQTYYGDTQYWCWITTRYHVQQIVLEYLWMWLAAFFNIIIYIFLALVVRGFITVDGSKIRIPNKREREGKRLSSSSIRRKGGVIALQMLFYPAVYIVTVIPISVVRFTAFGGYHIPFAGTAVADVIFALSGVLNVILFSLTRPKLMPSRIAVSRGTVPALDMTRIGQKDYRGPRYDGSISDDSITEWIAAPPPSFSPGKETATDFPYPRQQIIAQGYANNFLK
ncbi:hypothetical protein PLICRDRAFT_405927 [Plicaturopsis crispa FD-325 SS-3]|nr:hypothetical protein PLICRDRAFT_405927 [Plicaturopsis crispa FD-325 SS-3]